MDDLIIQKHNFELVKKNIKDFSEQLPSQYSLSDVDEKKNAGEWIGDLIFGGGLTLSHKVTGKELNELSSQIRAHLRSINEIQTKLTKEFRQIYNALDLLDKEYVDNIVTAINEGKKNTDEIQQIIKAYAYTIDELEKFKQKLDSYAHIKDIDKIWSDCQRWHDEISSLFNSLENVTLTVGENSNEIEQLHTSLECAGKQIEQLKKNLDEQILQVKSIVQYIAEIKKLTHLKDIDIIWNNVKSHEIKLEDLRIQNTATLDIAQKNNEAIAELAEFKARLTSITHLNDVDNLWNETKNQSRQIEELQNQGEETRNMIQHNKELIDQSFAAEKENTNSTLQKLNKKIQYAYWIAGGSMVLALVELILLKVM